MYFLDKYNGSFASEAVCTVLCFVNMSVHLSKCIFPKVSVIGFQSRGVPPVRASADLSASANNSSTARYQEASYHERIVYSTETAPISLICRGRRTPCDQRQLVPRNLIRTKPTLLLPNAVYLAKKPHSKSRSIRLSQWVD